MPHEIDLAVEDARWETAIPGLEALVARAVEAGLAIAPEKRPADGRCRRPGPQPDVARQGQADQRPVLPGRPAAPA
jgi:hypothetical protein